MDLRSLQKPLKEQYRNDPTASQITLRAKGGQTDVPMSCSIDLGRAIYNAEAPQGSWRRGCRRMFWRPATGSTGGLRADHLPDGRRGDEVCRPTILKLPWREIWTSEALLAWQRGACRLYGYSPAF